MCASGDISTTSGYMHYRYGDKKHPQKIASSAKTQDKPVSFSYQDGRDITYMSLEFGNEVNSYSIDYNRIITRVHGQAMSARFDDGVIFYRNNTPIKHIKCTSPAYTSGDLDYFLNTGIKEKG